MVESIIKNLTICPICNDRLFHYVQKSISPTGEILFVMDIISCKNIYQNKTDPEKTLDTHFEFCITKGEVDTCSFQWQNYGFYNDSDTEKTERLFVKKCLKYCEQLADKMLAEKLRYEFQTYNNFSG